jgi:hypothetical protein
MTEWMLPWVADENNVPGLRNIVEGLKLDGYPYQRLREKPFKGPLLDKLEPVLESLELSDKIVVATNSVQFQSYSLANILPVVWSLTTRQRVYTTDTPEIVKTLLSFSVWEGEQDRVSDTQRRLESYPLLVWSGIETRHKQMLTNSSLIASLLRKRINRVYASHSINAKTLAVYLYHEDFKSDRMEEDLIAALGASVGSVIIQDFMCINAHFSDLKAGVVSI